MQQNVAFFSFFRGFSMFSGMMSQGHNKKIIMTLIDAAC